MDQRDINILIQALLKSVIESGAPKEQWKDLVKHGVLIHAEFMQLWQEKQKAKEARK